MLLMSRTKNASQLAAIYTAANAFFNPTTEDNYPTVNLEAEACGTPVVTYDTGGCGETVKDARSVVVGGYTDALRSLHTFGDAER